ncbi:hypothetical protein ATK30_4193 [Amycolatopsis echigonensis]|uniref:Uncharacterized protein n=1 Tax=Amycolatopsis echigonensis TaxID=2576905 RepID=A0A2N3WHJ7_9PSEU|nr:hypothetical protein ATK30_4193 [Amycolatopsis niigatensis]
MPIADTVDPAISQTADRTALVSGPAAPVASPARSSADRVVVIPGWLAVAIANAVGSPVCPSTSRYRVIYRRFAVALSPSASRAGVSSGRLAVPRAGLVDLPGRQAAVQIRAVSRFGVPTADLVGVPVCASTGCRSVVFRGVAVPPADPVDLSGRQAAVQIRAVSRFGVPTADSVGVPVRPPSARLGAPVPAREPRVRLRPPSSRLGPLGVRAATAWLSPASARFREPTCRFRMLCPGLVGESRSFAGGPREHIGHADAAVSVHRTAASSAGASRGVGMATGAGGVALVGHSVSSRTSGARLGRLTFEHPAASPGLPGLVVPGELFVIVRIPAVRDDTLPRISSPCVALRHTEADEQVKIGFSEWSNRRRALLRVRNYLCGLAVVKSDLVASCPLRGVKEIVRSVELARPRSSAVREADADRDSQARTEF